jgi:uncharacterized protein (TIGR03435 family)
MRSLTARWLALIIGMLIGSLRGEALIQAPATFDAISIHRNLSGTENTHIDIAGGRLTITNASLKTLIRNAYDLLSFQLAGGPVWLDTEMYDIVATTGSSEKISTDQYRVLLQSLLADRFKLKIHWETRQMAIYALVPGKGAMNVQTSTRVGDPSINTQKALHRAQMVGGGEPIAILASNLGHQLGTLVLDETGLKGAYDWKLVWDPNPDADSSDPALLTAVQDQLGMKLRPEKGPVQVLAVDSVDRIPEN